MQLSATRRGARLARRLSVQQLAEWGWGYDSVASGAVAHVVAELAVNAVQHGRVPGRDFRLRMALDDAERLRVEVVDARFDRLPPGPARRTDALAETGRGLVIVRALADRWGVELRPAPCKTVWAELNLRSAR
ncbi:ATP-binding protein [Streptomyces sp. DSM 42041]|uniref:ATP-binding protein n=1 Tax=Streptomyces hazeniae TaxID=3075538 RepID=A0ABU2NKC1_9ACTN|nr:ATP-binding protein [Streptomyces sp. DSM 42041]MDT0377427.1 ATP-binding protein [Streptomyces sp. DSM 42041]